MGLSRLEARKADPAVVFAPGAVVPTCTKKTCDCCREWRTRASVMELVAIDLVLALDYLAKEK